MLPLRDISIIRKQVVRHVAHFTAMGLACLLDEHWLNHKRSHLVRAVSSKQRRTAVANRIVSERALAPPRDYRRDMAPHWNSEFARGNAAVNDSTRVFMVSSLFFLVVVVVIVCLNVAR